MGDMFLEMVFMLFIDIIFIGLLVLALVPLGLYRRAAFAILKRNFVGYFSNPTGYVFLCIFVLLTSFAAFWPHEFFNANLANLDQLNKFMPLIMLVFVPAITMSIWSEERRQGTDELLLTLPAGDFDVVMGKFLAAATIFTVSLLFSQLSNFAVLVSLTLGNLDAGLLATTYLGYWLIGMGMLAVGMVASFLTSNLTVGFILGAVFNAPLAFAGSADVIVPGTAWARMVSQWGLGEQFDDMGRGVISISSSTYFIMLVVIGIYLSMVLIGRRHWMGGRDGHSMLGHYVVRTFALLATALFANVLFSNHDLVRVDATEGRVSSLSPDTRKLVRNLDAKHPIVIDAFASAEVPEDYVKTRFELISMLKEFKAMSGGKIEVRINDNLEPFSEQAVKAEQRFDITPQTVRVRSRGAWKDEEFILGAAFTCGLEKVVVPFFDYGIPVEYELIRSIATVAKGERHKLGVVRSEAQMFGGFSFAGGMPQNIPKQEIIEELEKQYEVEEVDPTQPIEADKYDVLLVAQPSSLGPEELDNVVAAIRDGQPAAVFEDPLPRFIGAPGTSQPRPRAGGGMFGGGGPPPPKGDMEKLWNLLGVKAAGEDQLGRGFQAHVVWQKYNPYRKIQIQGITDEWVFIRPDASEAEPPFNPAEPITAGLDEVLFPWPGAIEPEDSDLEFTELVSTCALAGTIDYQDYLDNQADPVMLQVKRKHGLDGERYVLAAHISGKPEDNLSMSDEGSPLLVAQNDADDGDADEDAAADEDADTEDADAEEGAQEDKPLNVVYVADLDCLSSDFVRVRARPDEEINWRFDNVTFVLNVFDVLAGINDYVNIRTRKTHHSTLRVIEQNIEDARSEELEARARFEEEYNKAVEKAEEESRATYKKLQEVVDELQEKQAKGEEIDPEKLKANVLSLNIKQNIANRKLEMTRERLRRDRDQKIAEIRRRMDLKIQTTQNWFKFWAVVLPPIPPLLVGLIVFVSRRLREREGVSKARLR